jgi:hypothetical protein
LFSVMSVLDWVIFVFQIIMGVFCISLHVHILILYIYLF